MTKFGSVGTGFEQNLRRIERGFSEVWAQVDKLLALAQIHRRVVEKHQKEPKSQRQDLFNRLKTREIFSSAGLVRKLHF